MQFRLSSATSSFGRVSKLLEKYPFIITEYRCEMVEREYKKFGCVEYRTEAFIEIESLQELMEFERKVKEAERYSNGIIIEGDELTIYDGYLE